MTGEKLWRWPNSIASCAIGQGYSLSQEYIQKFKSHASKHVGHLFCHDSLTWFLSAHVLETHRIHDDLEILYFEFSGPMYKFHVISLRYLGVGSSHPNVLALNCIRPRPIRSIYRHLPPSSPPLDLLHLLTHSHHLPIAPRSLAPLTQVL